MIFTVEEINILLQLLIQEELKKTMRKCDDSEIERYENIKQKLKMMMRR